MKDVEILTSHLGTALLIGTLYLTWLLRTLSRRMGEVTRMRAYFRGFDLGNALILTATLTYLLICSAALSQQPVAFLTPTFQLIAFYIPLALGLAFNLGITLFYWGWLITER